MATKPESRLQRRIRGALERAFPGSYWRKIHGSEFQSGGMADLIGCVEGLFFAFEVKRPGLEHTTSQLQDEEIEDVRAAGGISHVISSSEQAIQLVHKALARAKKGR